MQNNDENNVGETTEKMSGVASGVKADDGQQKHLGYRLKSKRIAAGITQKYLGVEIGVVEATIQNWEYGKTKPGVDRIEQLANALGCTPNYLSFGGEPEILAGDVIMYPDQMEEVSRQGPHVRSPELLDQYNLPANQDAEFGQAAENLRLIYNSGEKEIIRAINNNLEVFVDAVKRKSNEQQARDETRELHGRLSEMESKLQDLVKKNIQIETLFKALDRRKEERRQRIQPSPDGKEHRSGLDRRETPTLNDDSHL